jgi:hypothetical protein
MLKAAGLVRRMRGVAPAGQIVPWLLLGFACSGPKPMQAPPPGRGDLQVQSFPERPFIERRGRQLGRVGFSGDALFPHLHYNVTDGGGYPS